MGGESFLAGDMVHGVSVGETYTLCSDCMKLVNAAKGLDCIAQNRVRKLAKEFMPDTRKREWLFSYLNIKESQEELDAIARQEEELNEYRQRLKIYQDAEIAKMKEAVSKHHEMPVFDIEGCRGRSIKVYSDRVVLNTDATLGAILTNNATDGEKTIFYHDVVGIQFKDSGLTIGYLQLETASGQMNNLTSNQFSENTFTFDTGINGKDEEIHLMRDYIIWRVSQYKQR